MKQTFVFTGGGTAGHVMPNLALAPHFADAFELHYIGSETGIERKLAENAGFIYHAIPVVKLDRSRKLKNLGVPFKLLKAESAAKKVLRAIRPAAVFSKGGYVALPVALTAGCPLFIHESDFTLGLANKLAAGRAEAVFTSFADTAGRLKNGVFTGAPIRASLYGGNAGRARSDLALPDDLPTLLVIGGSTGARAVNDCVYRSAEILCETFNVVHITGAGNDESPVVHPRYRPIRFTERIEDIFALADIAVTRGGAGVLFELAALKIPSLIVPLPAGGASRGDQVQNARYFEARGYGAVLEQSALTPESLVGAVGKLYRGRSAYMAALAKADDIDGTEAVVAHIRAVLDKKR